MKTIHFDIYNQYDIGSTLTAIVFLNYTVVAKITLEISGHTMCRVRLWRFAWLEGVEAIFLGTPR